ncbi:hypothetical protein BU16DRAFT_562621 [Lophium mytilinum]|uniref:Rhodopsin domain-containing protein n=1 Tax=Lophium mytilinum TaxID=390894 RepID=A0A6A6QSP3_9PEZI|nr:hypothetical protein BU16DRAFT_562621 [Lophium mytilinum]
MLKQMALTLVVVNGIFLSLACITLGLRVWIRSTRGALGTDDWLLLVGLLLFAVTVAMSTMSAHYGLGVHNYGASAAEMQNGVMYFALWQLFYVTSTVPVKASICISLLRITTKKLFRGILWALIVLSSISTFMACVVVWSTCRPMAATWDKSIKGAKCSSLEMIIALSYLVSGVNVVTDWTCAILPAFILWDIQMRTKLKFSVCVILGMGAAASTATLIRLKAIPSYRNANDYLYGIAEIAIWSTVEIGLGIIAGSVATLKPLFNKVFGSSTDPSSYADGRTPRPYPGSYRLHDVSKNKSAIETTITGRGENDRSDISDEDTASQRRILGRAGAGLSSKQNGGGITVTRDISVEAGSNADLKSTERERRVADMI